MLNRTPFVGREAQLEQLSAELEEALHGRGSIAMLRGEPGIGKTRTLESFPTLRANAARWCSRAPATTANGSRPIGPFAEAIMEYAREAPTELAAADRQARVDHLRASRRRCATCIGRYCPKPVPLR